MTTPPLQPPPTLDLLSSTRRPLHRPLWVATACFLSGTGIFFSLVAWAVSFFVFFRSFFGMSTLAEMEIRLVSIGMIMQGTSLLTFCFTDLTAGAVNPWPRRLMGGFGSVAAIVGLAAQYLFWRHLGSGASPRVFTDFYRDVFMPMVLVSGALAVVCDSLGLAYILQLAHWLRSASLAVVGGIVLGLGLLSALAVLALGVMIEAMYHGTRIPYRTFNRIYYISTTVRMIIALLFIVFAFTLGARLIRAVRRRRVAG